MGQTVVLYVVLYSARELTVECRIAGGMPDARKVAARLDMGYTDRPAHSVLVVRQNFGM